MNIDTLLDHLEHLAWDEQVEFEMGERHPESIDEGIIDIEHKVEQLGVQLTPVLLDQLELHEDGDPRWLLRLSPYVAGDNWQARASRYLHDEDSEVRYWANWILEKERNSSD